MPTTRKHRHLRTALAVRLALALVLATGCATLFNPAVQNIPVATHPDGGEVWVDGKLIGTAPIILKLDTRKNHDITVRRGNDIRTWTLKQQFSSKASWGLAGDAVILVPGVTGAVFSFVGATRSTHSLFVTPSQLTFIGIGSLVVGLTPLAIDVATNQFYELEPGELTVDFD